MAKRRSSKTSKPNVTRTPRKKVASGSAIGKRSKKMVGCKACNFGTPYVVAEKTSLSTGKPCPRCHSPNSLMTFDSTAEWVYGNELRLLQEIGEISDLQYQVRFDLHCASPDPDTKPPKVTTYISDFTYIDKDDTFVVVDVKGGNSFQVVVSPEAKMKMKWFELEYGIPVTIVGR